MKEFIDNYLENMSTINGNCIYNKDYRYVFAIGNFITYKELERVFYLFNDRKVDFDKYLSICQDGKNYFYITFEDGLSDLTLKLRTYAGGVIYKIDCLFTDGYYNNNEEIYDKMFKGGFYNE